MNTSKSDVECLDVDTRYVVTVIATVALVVFIYWIINMDTDGKTFDLQEKYVVSSYPKERYCTNCGELNHKKCSECVDCGYCYTPNGTGECVSGDENGPYFRADCVDYEYRSPEVINGLYYPRGPYWDGFDGYWDGSGDYAWDRWGDYGHKNHNSGHTGTGHTGTGHNNVNHGGVSHNNVNHGGVSHNNVNHGGFGHNNGQHSKSGGSLSGSFTGLSGTSPIRHRNNGFSAGSGRGRNYGGHLMSSGSQSHSMSSGGGRSGGSRSGGNHSGKR